MKYLPAIRLCTLLTLGSRPIPCPAQSSPPPELPTEWVPPPGDRLEHETAGFAKVLCSALFLTGRDLAASAAERTLALLMEAFPQVREPWQPPVGSRTK